MKSIPVSVVNRITLDQGESKTFRQRLPSSRDVEAFVEGISEEGSSIYIGEQDEIEIEIETQSECFPYHLDVKRELIRIRAALNEVLLS